MLDTLRLQELSRVHTSAKTQQFILIQLNLNQTINSNQQGSDFHSESQQNVSKHRYQPDVFHLINVTNLAMLKDRKQSWIRLFIQISTRG